MNYKQKNIIDELSPIGQKLMYQHDIMFNKTKHLMLALLIIDLIAAILVVPAIIKSGFSLNLFGFVVELEETFWSVILYIAISSFFITVFIFIYALIGLLLSAKAESLNNKYRTMLLNKKIADQNEQIIKMLNDLNNHTDKSQTVISE